MNSPEHQPHQREPNEEREQREEHARNDVHQPRHARDEQPVPPAGVWRDPQPAIGFDRDDWPPAPGIWVSPDVHDNSGIWLDAATDPDTLRAAIADGFIYDSIGFGSFVLDPDESPDVIARVASGIQEHGLAFAAWAELHDADPDMLADFERHYLGHFTSYDELGRNLIGATGWDAEQLPEHLRPWISVDYAAAARYEIEHSRLIALTAAEAGGLDLFLGPTAEPEGAPAEAKP